VIQRKFRIIKKGATDKKDVYGLSLPKEFKALYSGTFFKVERTGDSILLTSGTKVEYSNEQVENYKFEDCQIGN